MSTIPPKYTLTGTRLPDGTCVGRPYVTVQPHGFHVCEGYTGGGCYELLEELVKLANAQADCLLFTGGADPYNFMADKSAEALELQQQAPKESRFKGRGTFKITHEEGTIQAYIGRADGKDCFLFDMVHTPTGNRHRLGFTPQGLTAFLAVGLQTLNDYEARGGDLDEQDKDERQGKGD